MCCPVSLGTLPQKQKAANQKSIYFLISYPPEVQSPPFSLRNVGTIG